MYFFLIHNTKDFQVKYEIRRPNNLFRFNIFFHLKVRLLVYSIYPFHYTAE